MSNGPVCQSCGMPLKKEEDFGTNVDGSKNIEFCNFCYMEGRFTDEGITMEEKINKLVGIGKAKLGMTENQAMAMAKGIIPNLKRWKK
jgi:hypothetical protein